MTLSRRVHTHCHKVEARADAQQVRVIAAVAAADWDLVALRIEQLNDPDIEPLLHEVEAVQRPQWKDIADCSSIYKSYWAQWTLLSVRNGILQRNWESPNRRSQVAQVIIPWSRLKDVLMQLHSGP
jgi:hypothetical protein